MRRRSNFSAPLAAVIALVAGAGAARATATSDSIANAAPAPGYDRYDAVVAALAAIARLHPHITRVVDVTMTTGARPTAQGRHLHALVVSASPHVDQDEPAVLLVAGLHAREIAGPVLALHVAQRLTDGYGADPEITKLVDHTEIWIAPVWNPDGYEHALTVDPSWRKNRRPFQDFVGVDLNRNYPFGWEAPCGGSSVGHDETFRGTSAASEAETDTMLRLGRIRPFAKLLDVHAAGRQVVFGTSCWRHPLLDYFIAQAGALSYAAGYGGARRTASATGEQAQHAMAAFGALAFTLEIGEQFSPPRAEALAEAVRVWPGVLWWLREPTPVWGHVTDGCTGRPLAARVRYGGVPLEHDESSVSGGPFGRWHAFVPPGVYAFEFVTEGYVPAVASLTLRAGKSVEITASLLPPYGCRESPRRRDDWEARGGARPDANGSVAAPTGDTATAPDDGSATGCSVIRARNNWTIGWLGLVVFGAARHVRRRRHGGGRP